MKTLTTLLLTLLITGCAIDQNAWYMSPQPARCPQPVPVDNCRTVFKYDSAHRFIGEQRVCGHR